MDKQSQITFFNSQAENPQYIPDQKRLESLARLCSIKQDARVLEVACGTGYFTKALLETPAASILAVDFAPKMIEIAGQHITDPRVEFRHCDVMDLTEGDFDCAVICNAFQFFENRGSLIRQLHHLIAIGGRVMICAPYSRCDLNGHYGGVESELVLPLPAAQTLANTMQNYFDVDILIDSQEFYAVSGVHRFA